MALRQLFSQKIEIFAPGFTFVFDMHRYNSQSHKLRGARSMVFTAVLFFFLWFVFSLEERKRTTDRMVSTMLPQASSTCMGDRVTRVNQRMFLEGLRHSKPPARMLIAQLLASQ